MGGEIIKKKLMLSFTCFSFVFRTIFKHSASSVLLMVNDKSYVDRHSVAMAANTGKFRSFSIIIFGLSLLYALFEHGGYIFLCT